jgi:hypothetical protein
MSSSSSTTEQVKLHTSELWHRESGSSSRFFVAGAELAGAVSTALAARRGRWKLISSSHNSVLLDESRELDGAGATLIEAFARESRRFLVMRPELLEEAMQTSDPGATASLSGCLFVDFNPLDSPAALDPSAAMVVNRVRSKLTGEVDSNIEGPRLFAALKKALRPLLVHQVAIRLKTGEVELERGLLASEEAARVLRKAGDKTYWRLA